MLPILALALPALAGASTVSSLAFAPRIAPVAASCPADRSVLRPRERTAIAQEEERPNPFRALRIDADGVRDRCVTRSPASCPTGTALEIDAAVDGKTDLCAADDPNAAAKSPECDDDSKLRVDEGEDACEESSKPECPRGFKLKPARGEDQCHH